MPPTPYSYFYVDTKDLIFRACMRGEITQTKLILLMGPGPLPLLLASSCFRNSSSRPLNESKCFCQTLRFFIPVIHIYCSKYREIRKAFPSPARGNYTGAHTGQLGPQAHTYPCGVKSSTVLFISVASLWLLSSSSLSLRILSLGRFRGGGSRSCPSFWLSGKPKLPEE